MTRVHPLVKWSLCLLLFSLPLEMPNRFVFELTTMVGAWFLLTTALELRLCYSRAPWALMWFVGLLAAVLLSFIVQGGAYPAGLYVEDVFKGVVFLVLWISVFWAAANLFRHEHVARAAFGSLMVGCLLRSGLPLIGIGKTASVESFGGERVTAFGQGPNQSAQVLAIGLIALIGLVFVQRGLAPRLRHLGWAAVGLVAIGLVDTGSRGGLLMLVVGIAVLLNGPGHPRIRLRNTALMLVALGLVAAVAMSSEVLRRRFADAEQGNLAGRERIFPELVGMFMEKPWLGWGPITNKYEVAARLGDPEHEQRDAHNILLELLTSTGLVGTLLFLTGVWFCFTSAWSARAGPRGMVPLAMLLAVMAGNMSGNRLTGPLLWLVFAYAVSGAQARRRAEPPAAAPRPRERVRSPVPIWAGQRTG
jgi:O-antigen ligase